MGKSSKEIVVEVLLRLYFIRFPPQCPPSHAETGYCFGASFLLGFCFFLCDVAFFYNLLGCGGIYAFFLILLFYTTKAKPGTEDPALFLGVGPNR
jgi:hypothetical protein